MSERRPTRRRSTRSPTVDHAAVVGYILRRCGRGCSLDYQVALAEQLFAMRPFPPSDQQQILVLLRNRFGRDALSIDAPVNMNASTVCGICRHLVGEHPADKKQPHLVVLCTGQRVRVV